MPWNRWRTSLYNTKNHYIKPLAMLNGPQFHELLLSVDDWQLHSNEKGFIS